MQIGLLPKNIMDNKIFTISTGSRISALLGGKKGTGRKHHTVNSGCIALHYIYLF
jgi:hypothetical protein